MSFTPAQIALLEENRDLIEARRIFRFDFASLTIRWIEGSTPWNDGQDDWEPAHQVINAPAVDNSTSSIMEASPAIYRLGYFGSISGIENATADLADAYLNDEDEWRGALVTHRLVLFLENDAVGPPIHIHRGRIEDIRWLEDAVQHHLEVRVEGPFKDRNAAALGKYTDRDQQMRSPGDRGCEYVALYESSGAEFVGWLQG